MALTFEQLVKQTRHLLYGAGYYEDRVAELQQPLSEKNLTVELDDATEFGKGVIEVGFEQMRVQHVSDNKLTLYKFGRGYNGTEASRHREGSEITYQPLFAASTVRTAIQRVLRSIYPSLYVVKTATIPNGVGHLPDDAIGIVHAHTDGNRQDWYRFEPDQNNKFTNRYSRDTEVTYACKPGELVDAADDFTEATGFDERIADLVATGAAAELAPFLDVARVGHAGMEARVDNDSRPAGYGVQVASKMRADFQRRLDNEIAALHKEHPLTAHKERLHYGA